MNERVWWVFELQLKAGKSGELTALMQDMVRATQANEPGTLTYEWTASADGSVVHLHEGFADAAAAMVHCAAFGANFAGRFFDVLQPVRMTVYGAPDDAVKSALAGLAPTYLASVGGFTR